AERSLRSEAEVGSVHGRADDSALQQGLDGPVGRLCPRPSSSAAVPWLSPAAGRPYLHLGGPGPYAWPATDEPVEGLIATAAKDDAGALCAAIVPAAPEGVHVFERKNLGGDAAAWLVLASLLAPQIPAVLTFVRGLVDRSRVSSIKVGDVEIVNPTADQV